MNAPALDCAIIGGGPAGLTAATYLRRFHRDVRVFDDGRSRARWIPGSHNCPGFPVGVSGTRLLDLLRAQAEGYGARIVPTRIVALEEDGGRWRVADGERTWTAQAVLLACGVQDRLPALAAGDPLQAVEDGVIRVCAICDGYEATDARIAVHGPVADALAHAAFLRTFSADITVVPLPDEAVAAAHVAQAGAAGIVLLPPLRALRCDRTGCEVTDDAGHAHRFDTLYPVLGAVTRSTLARQAGARMDAQQAVVVDAHQRTSLPGLYAAGDMVTDINQISVAFGHAAIAATAIHRALAPRPRAR